MDYFNPEFLLGLTATPDRMDNQDIYSLFDKNVPYELRLRDAIINDLIAPFHYYGIRDKLIDYDSKASDYELIKGISDNLHLEFVIEEINKHKLPGKLKAVVFCKNISHVQQVSEGFNQLGIESIALIGKNDVGSRINAFNRLQNDGDSLQIICAVDILNEGVDIPQINMVVFLRPTESSTIFIQQLGRGLRKYENKPYLVVLDFIGNSYKRSTQIAIALGSLTNGNVIEKNLLRDLIKTDFVDLQIPNVIIDIDELSKEDMLKYLDETNFNKVDQLKKDYQNFKRFINTETFPKHIDYLTNDCAPDLMRFMKSRINGGKNLSYYSFLKKIKEDSIPIFSDDEITFINNLSDLLPLVRLDEYLIVKSMIENVDIKTLIGNSNITNESFNNAMFYLEKDKIIKDNKLLIDVKNQNLIDYINDLLEYGINRYLDEFGEFDGKFKLYGSYQKNQIFKILNKESQNIMSGAEYDLKNHEAFLFVGLKKDGTKEELHNYKDKFLSSKIFQWESKNNTTLGSKEAKKHENSKTVHLFIRKMDEEDGIRLPFIYFGTGVFTNVRVTSNANTPTLTYDIVLDNEVPNYLKLDFNIKEEIKDETC